jgi:aromatic ring-opening dioxygenase catalytic subunit (LigB family)
LVVIYNDHVDNYSFDAWPTFALGVANEFQIADEGWGPRRFAPVPGHRALARHLAARLLDGGFDLMTSHRMELDHGFLSPMPLIDEGWHISVVPMTINVVLDPLPAPASLVRYTGRQFLDSLRDDRQICWKASGSTTSSIRCC